MECFSNHWLYMVYLHLGMQAQDTHDTKLLNDRNLFPKVLSKKFIYKKTRYLQQLHQISPFNNSSYCSDLGVIYHVHDTVYFCSFAALALHFQNENKSIKTHIKCIRIYQLYHKFHQMYKVGWKCMVWSWGPALRLDPQTV